MIAWAYLDKRTAAVAALKDYSSMEYILLNHKEVEETLRERMVSIGSSVPSGMPHNQNPHAGEAQLTARLDEINVIQERYRQALEYMAWFRPAWANLTEDEQFVLSEFYCADEQQTDSVGSICDRYQIERSSAYNKKNRALGKLALLLYGK